MSKITFEKDFPKHPIHYFTLLSVMLVGLWGIFLFSFQPAMQLSIVISMSIAYVIWGISHHRQHHDLHIKIVFEYVLVALLGILIIGSLLIRA
jgi:hypothetical protein